LKTGERGLPVAVRGVTHGFEDLEVLDAVGFEIAPGEVVGLVGPSGSGKSTLLELVAGLQDPRVGSIGVGSAKSSEERLAHCALMPQGDQLLPWASAIDNAAIALRNRGASRRKARAEAHPLFERFGLAGFESARPRELSGGMQQRIAFLRTLLAHKPVLLLDEPFASLDTLTRADMQEWLAEALRSDPHTVLLVTHDVEEALYLCDRVLMLSKRPGRLVGSVAAPAPRAVPRLDAVTSAGFTTAREKALATLHGGQA
jgi:NitT/TauT family transport system ATP-binding protein